MFLNKIDTVPFRLSELFMAKYRRKKAPFGFNGLGELVYNRTYSRLKDDGKNEQWWETVQRVVEGTFNMQKQHIDAHGLGWNAWKAQHSAQEMYDRIFNMKFLPPGRGLWAMGTPITEKKNLHAALNNCAFVSTDQLKSDFSKPFAFLMDASMLGVGVGFDTKGEQTIILKGPNPARKEEVYLIPDTREGWVESLKMLLDSYSLGTGAIILDYTDIRPAGVPIKGFGGESSGPDPLIELHEKSREILDAEIGKPLSITAIVDIMNLIGKCVVAGNVRRSAEIVFGEPDSEEYLDLKNYEVNPHRAEYGWTSNNSIFATTGMDYQPSAKRVQYNGEPGYAWLENMRAYGRMVDAPNWKDSRACGGNPCLEQTLESYELCCLVETFPNNHDSLEDYLVTLKYAYLYAKSVTLGKTHWPETNRVMLRNRRIGCSMSGIAQFVAHHGVGVLQSWMDKGYQHIQQLDKEYSDWMAIPRSIKTTSIKPSGTVSLLAGATPGIHFPESRYYIRRMRLGIDSALVPALEKAGYKLEPAFGSEKSTLVVEIPVDIGEGVRTLDKVSMWEQLSLAALAQKYWADNQVSCTVTFDPEIEGPQIANALDIFQYQLKGISFLPRLDIGAYSQMPYESIDQATYEAIKESLGKLNFGRIRGEEVVIERFCDNDVCELDFNADTEVIEA
ncbi:MAG TPA: fused protease/ribonucleoside-triphosphate reductase [Cytophagales bacterium]|nr:fused protease/ribonucleoside-triphosphate reductase [Cytophagales bacterium]